jgi:hypothetical protein
LDKRAPSQRHPQKGRREGQCRSFRAIALSAPEVFYRAVAIGTTLSASIRLNNIPAGSQVLDSTQHNLL